MKSLMWSFAKCVIGLDLAIAAAVAASPNAAMAIPFGPTPVACEVVCGGCTAATAVGCPTGGGHCLNVCYCTPAGGGLYGCNQL